MSAERAQAQTEASEARRRESAAATEVSAAKARMAAAKKLAHQAEQVRDDAARTASRRLDDAGAPGMAHENFLKRAWNGFKDEVRDITASPEFASWMNIISDVGEAISDIGTVLSFFSFIPGVAPIAAAFLLTGAAFKGVAFIGTLLAWANGNASKEQMLGRGLDFGLSTFAGLKAAKTAKELAKAGKLANGMMRGSEVSKLGGQVKRSFWYDDARKATGPLRDFDVAKKFGGTATKYLDKAHIDPATAFRGKTMVDTVKLTSKIADGGSSLVTDGRQLVKDIRQFHDPEDQHLSADEAPGAAKKMAGEGVDALFGKDKGVQATVTKKLAEYEAEYLMKEVVK